MYIMLNKIKNNVVFCLITFTYKKKTDKMKNTNDIKNVYDEIQTFYFKHLSNLCDQLIEKFFLAFHLEFFSPLLFYS